MSYENHKNREKQQTKMELCVFPGKKKLFTNLNEDEAEMRIPNTQRDEKTNFNMSDTGDRYILES